MSGSGSAVIPMMSSNHGRGGNSATSAASPIAFSESRSSSDPDFDLLPRRLFDEEPETESEVELSMNHVCSHAMRVPGPSGSCASHAQLGKHLKPTEDKELVTLLNELRATAQRVLVEDEWMFRSSDEILGFRDA